MDTMTLPFRIRPVASELQMRLACNVRSAAYGHHLPALRDAYTHADGMDRSGTCASFLAVDKATDRPVGTVRIQLSTLGPPLTLESSFSLPSWLQEEPRAELTRMSVVTGADPLVRLALWKTGFYFCLANQIRAMVIGARKPALIRQYKSLGFLEVTERPVPLDHAGGLAHSILWFDVRAAERTWHQASHPLYRFMFDTLHPDMDLFGPRWVLSDAADDDYTDEVSSPMLRSPFMPYEPSQRTSIEYRSLDTNGLRSKSSMPAARQSRSNAVDSLAVTAITGIRDNPSAVS